VIYATIQPVLLQGAGKVTMPIRVSCQQCDKTYKVKDELAGKRVKCPQGHVLVATSKKDDDKPSSEPAGSGILPLKVAPPQGVSNEPLVNPCHGQVRVLWLLALVFVGLALALAPFAVPPPQGVLRGFLILMGVIGGFSGGFAMGLAALMTRFAARQLDKQLDSFRRGEYIAHWSYGQDQWRSFAESEWKRERRKAWDLLVGFMLWGLAMILIYFLWPKDPNPQKKDHLFVVILIFSFSIGAGLLHTGLLRLFFGRASYRRALRRVRETYIGPSGIYYNGKYYAWVGLGRRLESFRVIVGKPMVLHFAAHRRVYLFNRTLRVLVPTGREEEAEGLLERITRPVASSK
jgi:hypothetical protein